MTSKMQLKLQFAGIALVVVSTGSALAADFPKEGKYDMTACLSGVATPIAFSKTDYAVTSESFATTLSNPPGGFLDKGAGHCIGFMTSFGGKQKYESVCEVVLPDGGKILSSFWREADGVSHRQFVAGTGIYEGIVASGIVESMGTFPTAKPGTFQYCNHQTGTYKLK